MDNPSGMVPVHTEKVPEGATPIDDISTFAMMIDLWHSQKFELANRLLDIGEGTKATMEDDDKPGELIEIVLEGATLHAFHLGIMTTLNLFKDLPFAASVEEQSSDGSL